MKRIAIAGLFITLFLSTLVFTYFAFRTEVNRNGITASHFESGDYGALYDFYMNGEPLLEGRTAVGTSTAPLTFIAVIDFQEESEQFYEGTVRYIVEEYIATGQARLYHKYAITEEEFAAKKGTFIYAAAAQCLSNNGGDLVLITRNLLQLSEQEVLQLLEKERISFPACADEQRLREDMVETRLFRIFSPSLHIGINGEDNTVLYGDTAIDRLTREIRFKQVTIGI